MISEFEGVRLAVEKAVHEAYKSLSEYSQNPNANSKAIFARKRMLDTFADGWNHSEERIRELETQIDILRSKIRRERIPSTSPIDRPVTYYDLIQLFMSFRYDNRRVSEVQQGDSVLTFHTPEPIHNSNRERKRLEHFDKVKERFPHLF